MSAAEPAAVFAALGDATRLALLARLNDGQGRSINTLAAAGPLTRQAVTKHLHVLEQAGLVRSRRAGRETQFMLRGEAIAAARKYLEGISREWDAALGRLKSLVEKP